MFCTSFKINYTKRNITFLCCVSCNWKLVKMHKNTVSGLQPVKNDLLQNLRFSMKLF